MTKTFKARKHNSSKLQELLDEVTPLEMEQTKVKMQLAARIENFVRDKGWNNMQFAEKLGKNPSEITKWFSGTQNFTTDVLTEIAFTLGVELTTLFGKKEVHVIYHKKIVGMKALLVQSKSPTEMKFISDLLKKLGVYITALNTKEIEDYGMSTLMKDVVRKNKVSRETVMRKLKSKG